MGEENEQGEAEGRRQQVGATKVFLDIRVSLRPAR